MAKTLIVNDTTDTVELILPPADVPDPLPAGYTGYEVADTLDVDQGDTFDGTNVTVRLRDTQAATKGDLYDKARTALTVNQAFLADSNVQNAEAIAQVQLLTRQVNALIRLLPEAKDLLNDTTGT